MNAYVISAFLHLVGGVLLAGYALFWVVMARGLTRSSGVAESTHLLDAIHRSRWPPGGAPPPLRLPLAAIGALLLGMLAVTGVLLLNARDVRLEALFAVGQHTDRFVRVLSWKLVLFVAVVIGYVAATVRPRLWLAYLNGLLVLAIVVVSALLGH